jgi:hypothetical protein
MQVTKDPYLPLVLLFDLLHQIFHGADLWVEVKIGINPLPVEIHSRKGVPVVADNDPVGIHARNEDEGVKSSQVLGLSAVTRDEIIYALEDLAARTLSRVNSRSNQYNLVLASAPLISGYHDLVERVAGESPAELRPLIVNQLRGVFYQQCLLKLVLPQHFLAGVLHDQGILLVLEDLHAAAPVLQEWGRLFQISLGHQNLFFVMDLCQDVSVSYRLGKCKIHRVLVVLELVIESQSVVVERPPLLRLLLGLDGVDVGDAWLGPVDADLRQLVLILWIPDSRRLIEGLLYPVLLIRVGTGGYHVFLPPGDIRLDVLALAFGFIVCKILPLFEVVVDDLLLLRPYFDPEIYFAVFVASAACNAWLCEIHYVEGASDPFLTALGFEVKPLLMAPRVRVDLHVQVVGVLQSGGLLGLQKVPALKYRVKHQARVSVLLLELVSASVVMGQVLKEAARQTLVNPCAEGRKSQGVAGGCFINLFYFLA